jgi:peptide/nickel transport system permease protein
MLEFLLRRLFQAALTLLGVMIITFLLFNVIAGDVSANYLKPGAPQEAKDRWLRQHGLDKPLMFNTRDEDDAFRSPLTSEFWDTQFTDFMKNAFTFRAESYRTGKTIGEIIAERAPYSLALAIPALGIGWMGAMVISLIVAYNHDRWADKLGVFLSVLGMCVPFLAYMILGQWLIFIISPGLISGTRDIHNLYIPIGISVIAGLGANVRFYRTIFLNEMQQDYIRTARAKGASAGRVLFIHVLRNGMLPILTQLVMMIPFLIMGNLLLETFFRVPGLGGTMLSSINNRDIPIISALTLLTAMIYITGILITDILYAVFDPRVRLR